VAARLGHALPAAAGWVAADDAAVAVAVEQRFAAEAADPEAFAAIHDATAGVDVGASGGAFGEFAAAAEAVRRACAAPDPATLAMPLARLASAACDLADPFLTSADAAAEVAGARAWFGELLEPDDAATIAAAESAADDPIPTAVTIESAAARTAIEQAVQSGDGTTLARLRRERLEAALRLASSAVRQAWALADSRPPAPAAVATVWPSPAMGAVRVAFTLPASAAARLEVLDVTGRRVLRRELGARVAGQQSVVLDAATVRALPRGAYFVRIRAGDVERVGRLVHVAR
jgi:hypothetical protein